MPHLNANTPFVRCYVRGSYLYSQPNNKEVVECYIFGVKSILNKPLLFHCQLQNGAIFWGLPISAFVWKKNYKKLSIDEGKRQSLLQWWDMQSNDISVTVFAYLQDAVVDLFNRDKRWMRGRYLFTIDDYYADLNSTPLGYATDLSSKCFHITKLDNGNFAAYPNNYCRFHNLNFVDPYDKKNPPKYRPLSIEVSSEFINEKS